MKLRLLLGTLLNVFFASFAMEGIVVQMPKADVLRQRLNEIGMSPIMKKTDIVKQLAKQRKPIGYIVSMIDSAMSHYSRDLKVIYLAHEPRLSFNKEEAMILGKQIILRALLEDVYPEILEKLIPVTSNVIDSDSERFNFDEW